MKFINSPDSRQENYHLASKKRREYHALPGTALNANKYRIISTDWPGPLIVDGKLACNDDSPLAQRFVTTPVIQLKEPGQ